MEAAADELAGRRGGGGRHQALAEHGGRLVHALLGPGVVKMVISNILLKLNMDKLLYIYFSTRLHTMNVKVASHNIYGLPQMLNIKYECKNAVMFSFEIDPFPSKIMKRNRCFLPLFAV